MRPERGIVKKAITDADGNLSRAASILDCSRQTLYTWIYQLGLERMAGIRLDNKSGLDRQVCKDTKHQKEMKSSVYSAVSDHASMHLVETQTAPDLPIQATFRVRESLWKQVRIEAIKRGCTVGELLEQLLLDLVSVERKTKEKGK